MPPRRPRPLSHEQLGDEGTTATPAPHNEKGAWVFTSPARPPPGSHFREIQVGNARKCPLDSTALPLRTPTCAGVRLGAAKKRACDAAG